MRTRLYSKYNFTEELSGTEYCLIFCSSKDEDEVMDKLFKIGGEYDNTVPTAMTDGALYVMDDMTVMVVHTENNLERIDEVLDHECCHMVDSKFAQLGFNDSRKASTEEYAYFYSLIRKKLRSITKRYLTMVNKRSELKQASMEV